MCLVKSQDDGAPSMNWSTLRPGIISNPGRNSLRKEEGNVGQNAITRVRIGFNEHFGVW
jgi:hypothetical protein